jgi:hypothetical protein
MIVGTLKSIARLEKSKNLILWREGSEAGLTLQE